MDLSKLLRRKTAWTSAIFLRDSVKLPLTGLPDYLLDSRQLFRSPTAPHTRADPFVFSHRERTVVFYETQVGDDPGRIEAAEISPSRLILLGPVLIEPFHLSYPAVFEVNGQLYLLPETQAAGELRLYRFRRFPDKIEFVRTLARGYYADPSPLLIGGMLYIFATSERGLELFMLHDVETGTLRLHAASPITDERDLRRCGGLPFLIDGRLVRPSQAFKRIYGDDLTLLAIDAITPTDYRERVLARNVVDRAHTWSAQGGHHVSVARCGQQWAIAVDGQAFDYYINKLVSRAMLWRKQVTKLINKFASR